MTFVGGFPALVLEINMYADTTRIRLSRLNHCFPHIPSTYYFVGLEGVAE